MMCAVITAYQLSKNFLLASTKQDKNSLHEAVANVYSSWLVKCVPAFRYVDLLPRAFVRKNCIVLAIHFWQND
jgi:hypothetical protein